MENAKIFFKKHFDYAGDNYTLSYTLSYTLNKDAEVLKEKFSPLSLFQALYSLPKELYQSEIETSFSKNIGFGEQKIINKTLVALVNLYQENKVLKEQVSQLPTDNGHSKKN